MKVTDLAKLTEKVFNLFDNYVKSKKINPLVRAHIKYTVKNLQISETSSRARVIQQMIPKKDWTLMVYHFVAEQIITLPEFKKLTQSIAKKYSNNVEALGGSGNPLTFYASLLEDYLRRLMFKNLDRKLVKSAIFEYASLFKSELELSQTEYNYLYYLKGIYFEPKSKKISDGVVIRKPQKTDLEYTKDIYDVKEHAPEVPQAILELNFVTRDELSWHEYTYRVFNAMRLYKLGSVNSQRFKRTKKTILSESLFAGGYGRKNYAATRQYTVKKAEVNTFVKFINLIEPKLNYKKDDKKYRSLHISIERYNSGLLEILDIDRKLMTAVMGLESLFTTEEDRGENAYKLSLRTAKLLAYFNYDANETRSSITQAYQFRNKVVHGTYIPQHKKKEMEALFPQILNYLRVALIIFLLSRHVGKNRMVKMIDEAIITAIQDKELKQLVKKNTKGFKNILYSKEALGSPVKGIVLEK